MLDIVFKITTILIPVVAFSFGFFSLFKNPRSRVVWLWFLSSMAIGVWGVGMVVIAFAKSEAQALFADKLLIAGSILIPILFYHFISALLYRERKDRIIIIVGYFLSLIFLVLNLKNSLVVGASSRVGFEFWLDIGRFYIPFFIYFLIYVIIAFINLVNGYLKSDGVRKRQLFYILVAMLIGFVGGVTDFFPELFNIYPFGNFVVFLYPLLMTYGLFLKK